MAGVRTTRPRSSIHWITTLPDVRQVTRQRIIFIHYRHRPFKLPQFFGEIQCVPFTIIGIGHIQDVQHSSLVAHTQPHRSSAATHRPRCRRARRSWGLPCRLSGAVQAHPFRARNFDDVHLRGSGAVAGERDLGFVGGPGRMRVGPLRTVDCVGGGFHPA
jgi:hypothetical protein